MPRDPNFCTDTFHQELCVQFDVTFTVTATCNVTNVICETEESGLGPCEPD
jgi:hypothetical protein